MDPLSFFIEYQHQSTTSGYPAATAAT